MNEPKPARASVDTERVIRDLLDAFKSLKTATAESSCVAGTEEEQLANLHTSDLASQADAPSGHSTEAPIIELQESEQVPAFGGVGDSEVKEEVSEGQSGQYGIIEAFCKDHGTIERLHVTREELQALADTSLLGTLACKQDVLFILRQTRAAKKGQADGRAERHEGSGKDLELSEFRWWAEHVRRESIDRLDESGSSNDLDHLNPLSRPFVLSMAVVLVTMAIAIGIEMC